MNSEQVVGDQATLGIKNDPNTNLLVIISIVCLAGIVFYILKCFMGGQGVDGDDETSGPGDKEFMEKQWELYRQHKSKKE